MSGSFRGLISAREGAGSACRIRSVAAAGREAAVFASSPAGRPAGGGAGAGFLSGSLRTGPGGFAAGASGKTGAAGWTPGRIFGGPGVTVDGGPAGAWLGVGPDGCALAAGSARGLTSSGIDASRTSGAAGRIAGWVAPWKRSWVSAAGPGAGSGNAAGCPASRAGSVPPASLCPKPRGRSSGPFSAATGPGGTAMVSRVVSKSMPAGVDGGRNTGAGRGLRGAGGGRPELRAASRWR
jgi:hypothetical protein